MISNTWVLNLIINLFSPSNSITLKKHALHRYTFKSSKSAVTDPDDVVVFNVQGVQEFEVMEHIILDCCDSIVLQIQSIELRKT